MRTPLLVLLWLPPYCCGYDVEVTSLEPKPVLSFLAGSSAYQQTFNPGWVVASAGTGGKAGLLIRSQNCTSQAGGCVHCNFAPCALGGPCQDVITFAELLSNDNRTNAPPIFRRPTVTSVVLAPNLSANSPDNRGVQDPRVAYDPRTGLYYVFYTCYNTGKAGIATAVLCLAVSRNPTVPDAWLVRKVVYPASSKSGALLIREEGPHYLIWGAGEIHITSTHDLTNFSQTPSKSFIQKTAWGNTGVESGPPPMRLSTGDYIFFHNSCAHSHCVPNTVLSGRGEATYAWCGDCAQGTPRMALCTSRPGWSSQARTPPRSWRALSSLCGRQFGRSGWWACHLPCATCTTSHSWRRLTPPPTRTSFASTSVAPTP
jgi:hypothetical protein